MTATVTGARGVLLAVAAVTLLTPAAAHASKPTQFASLRSVCQLKEGCVLVLVESEEAPPAPPSPPAAISRQPLPLPADPGGEYRFVNSCSRRHGYFVAVTRKSSPAVRVKVLRSFNDPALKPFSIALPEGPRLGRGCDPCIWSMGCRDPVNCGAGETCTLSLPSKGTRFIAAFQRSRTGWTVPTRSPTWVWVIGEVDDRGSPRYGSRLSTWEPATPELVAELERYFAAGQPDAPRPRSRTSSVKDLRL